MNHKNYLTILLLTFLVSGCTTLYRYSSNGEVLSVSGDKHQAVLYWYGEEGRLWYGKKYAQLDTSLQMRICGVGPKLFHLSETSRLELAAVGGDRRVNDIDASGQLQPVESTFPLKTGEYCGVILLNGKAVNTSHLMLTLKPSVAILCDSQQKPARYPKAQIYDFGSIQRIEATADDRKAPDPCVIR